jgi:hypothetical protein
MSDRAAFWLVGLLLAVAVVVASMLMTRTGRRPLVRLPQEPFLTDIIFMIGGVGGIAVAMGRLGNNIEYLPTDVRSQPWFDPLLSSIMAVGGLFIFVVGAIRLLLDLRARRR